MKYRAGFVTNSSTTCYLVINAEIITDMSNENLSNLLAEFVEKQKLQKEEDYDGEHISLFENYNSDGFRIYVNVKVPFDRALNEYENEMKLWLENSDIEVGKISVGICGYTDG